MAARINENYLFFLADNLREPTAFLLDCESNDTIILNGESYHLFRSALDGCSKRTYTNAYNAFKEFDFLLWD